MTSDENCQSVVVIICIICISHNISAIMKEQELQEVYEMVDSIPLSRPKRNINRDFADGLMMA